MNTQAETVQAELTAYESDQIHRIALWKSEPPNPFSELWKRVTHPGTRAIEKLIPKSILRASIEKSYDAAELIAGREDIKSRAGIHDLTELKNKPLEECDRLANQVGMTAQALAAVEGVATGAGGVLTTLIDIPLLFVLSLRTILRIGHCYGYPLEHRKGRHFVLGVLVAAASHSLESRRRRLLRLRELEDLIIEETQEEILGDELLSVLFQLEIFEEVPGVGAISGALLNLAFMRRIDVTAKRVFQERWLQDNGKVVEIEPAPVHERYLSQGLTGALGRVVYSGCFGLGFGGALPVFVLASVLRPLVTSTIDGLNESATSGGDVVERVIKSSSGTTSSAPMNNPSSPVVMPG